MTLVKTTFLCYVMENQQTGYGVSANRLWSVSKKVMECRQTSYGMSAKDPDCLRNGCSVTDMSGNDQELML